ncbi:MAG: glycerol kinase GlpK [Bacteroidota bacterium]
MQKYILALDQGTTSSRAVLFDEKAVIIGIEQQETKQLYPQPDRVEQDANEIWHSQLAVALKVIKNNNIASSQIAAIGITNQRETTVVWDKSTGEPICHAIIWQDKRTITQCETIVEQGWSEYIRANTGLVIDAYFSATKLQWILNHVAGAKEKAEGGELLFGTMDTFLMWKLSGGKLHITDVSNASRTMLFNIKRLCWDQKLLQLFGIAETMLPNVVDSSAFYGTTCDGLFENNIPLCAMIGDQQAALFGQACFAEGSAKNTYGTGCFVLMNTGSKPILSRHGLLTTIAWSINGKVDYALEGSVFVAGAIIKWLRDSLKLIANAAETEKMALDAGDNNGVYVVPAFAGLGAPYWDMNAKGTISGLTFAAEKKHIVRAALESMAYQTKDVLHAMQQDSGITLKELNVDGGAVANNFLMQFQADILNVVVNRPKVIESTAMGAAFLAGLAVGLWTKEQIATLRTVEKKFLPELAAEKRELLYNAWQNAVKRARLK